MIQFPVRDPDAAYVDTMLWLPKRHVSVSSITNALELWKVEKRTRKVVRLWRQTADHLVVPRAFISKSAYGAYSFPFIDLRPTSFEPVSLRFREEFSYRSARQEEAFRAFLSEEGGTFELGTGRGKTVAAHVKMLDRGGPSIVIVPNGSVLGVWKESLLHFLELEEKDIGIIKQERLEWEKPVVLAMINTLALRAKNGDLPEGFGRRFRLAVFDEVHHLAAPLFVETAPLFVGERNGLSATADRSDGTEWVYQAHLGPVFFSDTAVDLPPAGHFWESRVASLSDKERKEVTVRGELHLGLLFGHLATRADFLDERALLLRRLLARGKKVIALSQSTDVLRALHARFPGSALIIGEVDYEERPELLYRSRLAFVSTQLGVESINDVALDAMVTLTPFSSSVWLRQSVGRVSRLNPNDPKKSPEYHVLMDPSIPEVMGTCHAMRSFFRTKKYKSQLHETRELDHG